MKFPFIYTTKAVIGRRAKSEVIHNIGFVDAEPDAMTTNEVFTVACMEHRGHEQMEHIRYVSGKFYAPLVNLVRDASELTVDLFDSEESIVKNTNFLKANSIAKVLGYKIGDLSWRALTSFLGDRPTPAIDIPRIAKSIMWSDEVECRASVQNFVSGMISIDGVVYRHIEEPTIVVTPTEDAVLMRVHYGSRLTGTAIDLEDDIYVGDPATTKFFALSQLDSAIDHATHLSKVNDVIVTDKVSGSLHLDAPEVLEFDAAEDALVRCAHYVTETMKPRVGAWPRLAVETWLDIREAYQDWCLTKDFASLSMLPDETLPLFHEHLRNHDTEVSLVLEETLGEVADRTVHIPSRLTLK